jgi:diacylglycerol O-acyltransferase
VAARPRIIDLDHHIRYEQLPRPGTHGAAAAQAAQTCTPHMLPRDRPLWRLVVIEGLASGELVLYSKIHHALLDGQGGIALAQALLDTSSHFPKPLSGTEVIHVEAEAGARDRASTAARATVSQFARLIRAVPATLKMAKEALGKPGSLLGKLRDTVLLAPKTIFNVQIGPERAFAVASIDLARVKRAARGHGVSLNDVVMAMVAQALREYLSRHGGVPEEPLVVGMPISLRGAGDGEANNQVSMAQCPLPTQISDPLERLATIHAATASIKNRVSVMRDLIPTDFPGLAAPLWASGLSRLWAHGRISERLPALANLVISNVPGPPIELFLAGARVLHYYPVSIVIHGLALNVTVQSYGGHLEFGVISAKDVVARPDSITRAFERALVTLEKRLPK